MQEFRIVNQVHFSRTLVSGVVALGVSLSACAPPGAGEDEAAESNLKPQFSAHPGKKDKPDKAKGPRRPKKDRATAPTSGETQAPATTAPGAATSPAAPTSGASPAPTPAGPMTASLTDPSGDVSGGLGGTPDHVDLAAAGVTRTANGFEVRIEFGGLLPTRSEGSQVQNVAAFFDLEGDGLVDYETWGSLSDNGWGSSYRTPDDARFGSDSGVTARPDGSTLVLTFPLGHLDNARSFRWQVGTEWGTPEQIATGTTASDRAGEGGVAFPG